MPGGVDAAELAREWGWGGVGSALAPGLLGPLRWHLSCSGG